MLQRRGFALIRQNMSFERSLLSAQGYFELEMPDQALARNRRACPKGSASPGNAADAALHRHARQAMGTGAVRLCAPARTQSQKTRPAIFTGPSACMKWGEPTRPRNSCSQALPPCCSEPTYYYNLGCYDAVLGNLKEATQHLETSFQMDKKFREIASLDPDLKAIHGLLGK